MEALSLADFKAQHNPPFLGNTPSPREKQPSSSYEMKQRGFLISLCRHFLPEAGRQNAFFFFNCLRLIYITTGNEKSYLLFTQHILLGKAHLKHTTNKCLIPRQYDYKHFFLLHSNGQQWALHKLRLYKYTNKHILTMELKGSHKIHSDKNTPLSFHDEMV